MRWVEHVAHIVEMRNAFSILVGEPDEKRPLRTPRCTWEDNIRIDLREVQW
jgi:hypothetical protein